MSRYRAFFAFLVFGFILTLAGCSTASSLPAIQPPQPTGVLFLAAPPSSLAINAKVTISAAATFPLSTVLSTVNDFVTWSLSCASPGACGTFSTSADANGIVYTAPANIPSGGTVTITATSIATPAKSNSAVITIVPPIPISVTFYTPAPAVLQINASTPLIAAIANDVTSNPQVQWKVTCAASACGSFSPNSTGSESTTTYTAPAAIPSGGTVTITATSATDPTKSASTTILINPATPNLANGTYVFQMSSPVGITPSFTTGVFVAANGAIIGGEQDTISFQSDFNNDLVPYPLFQKITGGSYTVTSDANIQVSLQVGPSETETIIGSLAHSGHGFIPALNGSPNSTTLDLQTSFAAPAGGYAISLSGSDRYSGIATIGGVLNIDSPTGISGAGSILDVVDSYPTYSGAQSLTASTFSVPDSYGRIKIQLHPATTSTLPAIYLAGYIVDSMHIRLIETDDAIDSLNFDGVLGGIAIGQGSSTGHFSAASLAGSTYVFAAQGTDVHGAFQLAGILSAGSAGTITGQLNSNDLSNVIAASVPFTGTYTVEPTGRVTIPALTGSGFSYALHLYLTGSGSALVHSSDTADLFLGEAIQQQSTPFSAASLSGSYGLNSIAYIKSLGSGAILPAAVNGSLVATPGTNADTLTGFADSGTGSANFALSGSFSPAANGVFTGSISGFRPNARSTPASFSLYLIDPTQGILIDSDNSQLVLGRLQTQ